VSKVLHLIWQTTSTFYTQLNIMSNECTNINTNKFTAKRYYKMYAPTSACANILVILHSNAIVSSSYFCTAIWPIMFRECCRPPAKSAMETPNAMQFDGILLLSLYNIVVPCKLCFFPCSCRTLNSVMPFVSMTTTSKKHVISRRILLTVPGQSPLSSTRVIRGIDKQIKKRLP